jgi:hypothetical protein
MTDVPIFYTEDEGYIGGFDFSTLKSYPIPTRGIGIPFQPKRYLEHRGAPPAATNAPGETSLDVPSYDPYSTIQGTGWATDGCSRCWEFSSHGGEAQYLGIVVLPVVTLDYNYSPPYYLFTVSFFLLVKDIPTGLQANSKICFGSKGSYLYLDCNVIDVITPNLIYVMGGYTCPAYTQDNIDNEAWSDFSIVAGWSWVSYMGWNEETETWDYYDNYPIDLAQATLVQGQWYPDVLPDVSAGSGFMPSRCLHGWATQVGELTYNASTWGNGLLAVNLVALVWGRTDSNGDYYAINGARGELCPDDCADLVTLIQSDKGFGTPFPSLDDPTEYTFTLLQQRALSWFPLNDPTKTIIPSYGSGKGGDFAVCHNNIIPSNGSGSMRATYQEYEQHVDPKTDEHTGWANEYRDPVWCVLPSEQYPDVFTSKPIGTQQVFESSGTVTLPYAPHGLTNMWIGFQNDEAGMSLGSGAGTYSYHLEGDNRYFQDSQGNWVDKGGILPPVHHEIIYNGAGFIENEYVYEWDADKVWIDNDPWAPNKWQISSWNEPQDVHSGTDFSGGSGDVQVVNTISNGTFLHTPQIVSGRGTQLHYSGTISRHYLYSRRTGYLWRPWDYYPNTDNTGLICDRATQYCGGEHPFFYRGIFNACIKLTVGSVASNPFNQAETTQWCASDYETNCNGEYTLGYQSCGPSWIWEYDKRLTVYTPTTIFTQNNLSVLSGGSDAPFVRAIFNLWFDFEPLYYNTVLERTIQPTYGHVWGTLSIGQAFGPAVNYTKQLTSSFQWVEPGWDENGVWHNRNVTFNAASLNFYMDSPYIEGNNSPSHDDFPVNDWTGATIHIESVDPQDPPTGGEYLYKCDRVTDEVTSRCLACEDNAEDDYCEVVISGCTSAVDDNGLHYDASGLNGSYLCRKQIGLSNAQQTTYALEFASPITVTYQDTAFYVHYMMVRASNFYGDGGSVSFDSWGGVESGFMFCFTNRSQADPWSPFNIGDCEGPWSIGFPATGGGLTGCVDQSYYFGLITDHSVDYIKNATATISFTSGA